MLSTQHYSSMTCFAKYLRLFGCAVIALLLALPCATGCKSVENSLQRKGSQIAASPLPAAPATPQELAADSPQAVESPRVVASVNNPSQYDPMRSQKFYSLPSLPADFDHSAGTPNSNPPGILQATVVEPRVAPVQTGSFVTPAATQQLPSAATAHQLVSHSTGRSENSSPGIRLGGFTKSPNQVAGQTPATQEAELLAPEELLPATPTYRLPLQSEQPDKNIQISSTQDLISLTAQAAPLNKLLALIAEQHNLNIVSGADVTEPISVSISQVPLEEALDAILLANGYAWTRQKNIVIVSKISADKKTSAGAQGRGVQVFTLNYVTAEDVDKVVKGLLSPVGQSFTSISAPTDHRRAHEQLIVEDLPEYLSRIGNYLTQVDTAPHQVLIEAHVLQVTLKDNCRHGVNLQNIARIANSDVTLSSGGLASGVLPNSSLKIEGSQLEGILEAIKATTDSKTLASPKVAVVNNQEATLQVGSRIGYLLTTTTTTSTLQSVNFMDVGVILKVKPSITDDGQVLIQVNPQVSTGRINPTTELPESETTEVKSSVMLADGEAIVIGGLIKETDSDSRNKVPFLGDLWLVGWMFQRRETTRERNEIIITLLPRIIPSEPGCRTLDPHLVERAHTPLLYGDLQAMDRSKYEPRLPCYTERARDRRVHCPPGTEYIPSGHLPIQSPAESPRIFMTPESHTPNQALIMPQASEPANGDYSFRKNPLEIPQLHLTPP
jgi:type IV pilus assembly protein PilQ